MLVFYLIVIIIKEEVKFFVNIVVFFKREVCLIYIIISKYVEKGCYLRDLMFFDSNELVFIGIFCVFIRKKFWYLV